MGLNVIDTSKLVGYGVVTAPEVGAVVLVISETTKSVGYGVVIKSAVEPEVGLNVGMTIDCIDIDNSKSVGYGVVTTPADGAVVLVIPATTKFVGYRVITSPVVGAAVVDGSAGGSAG